MEFNHDNFPSWEKQYNLKQQIKENEAKKKSEILQKNKLQELYPCILFTQLKKQNDDYETDDGCTHYKDMVTGQIFSWDFIENIWMQHNDSYQNSLMDLFE